jgi:hypothetical protein
MGLFDFLFGAAQAEPADGKSVLEKYLNPEHKYILVADQDHTDPTTASWFYSDQNLADLQKVGVHKIAIEATDETVQAIIDGSVTKERFVKLASYPERNAIEYDGIRKAHSLGFEVKGIDVELGIETFLYDRYTYYGYRYGRADLSEEDATRLRARATAYVNKHHADESSESKARLCETYMKTYMDRSGEKLEVDRRIDKFLNVANRLHFDLKPAEEIKRFAGDDRVAVLMGGLHFTGSHNNVARNLGPDKSLIISTQPADSLLSDGPALSTLLPHKNCNFFNYCKLEAPSGGKYDARQVEQNVIGRYKTPPHKSMDYTGIVSPEDINRLQTVEAIYESAQLPVRKSDQFGPT